MFTGALDHPPRIQGYRYRICLPRPTSLSSDFTGGILAHRVLILLLSGRASLKGHVLKIRLNLLRLFLFLILFLKSQVHLLRMPGSSSQSHQALRWALALPPPPTLSSARMTLQAWEMVEMALRNLFGVQLHLLGSVKIFATTTYLQRKLPFAPAGFLVHLHPATVQSFEGGYCNGPGAITLLVYYIIISLARFLHVGFHLCIYVFAPRVASRNQRQFVVLGLFLCSVFAKALTAGYK